MHIAFAAGWGHHRLRTQLGSCTLLRLGAIKTIMLIFIFIQPFAERGSGFRSVSPRLKCQWGRKSLSLCKELDIVPFPACNSGESLFGGRCVCCRHTFCFAKWNIFDKKSGTILFFQPTCEEGWIKSPVGKGNWHNLSVLSVNEQPEFGWNIETNRCRWSKIVQKSKQFQTPLLSSRGLDSISLIHFSQIVHCRVVTAAAAAQQYNI